MTRTLFAALAAYGVSACSDAPTGSTVPPEVEYGDLLIRWKIQDLDGGALDCADLEVTTIRIGVGGKPISVDCSSEGEHRISDLPVQNYPVVVRLLRGDGNAIDEGEKIDNVRIAAGTVTIHDANFRFPRIDRTVASIDFVWDLNALAADARECARAGVATVSLKTLSGSIGDFDVTRPCAEGRFHLGDLAPGTYRVLAELEGDGGRDLDAVIAREITIRGGAATTFFLHFIVGDYARVVGIWTLTASTATVACREVDAQTVRMSLALPSGARTATAACSAGRIAIDEFVTAAIDPIDVGFTLLGEFSELTSTVASNVALVAGGTSTVGVVFDVSAL